MGILPLLLPYIFIVCIQITDYPYLLSHAQFLLPSQGYIILCTKLVGKNGKQGALGKNFNPQTFSDLFASLIIEQPTPSKKKIISPKS